MMTKLLRSLPLLVSLLALAAPALAQGTEPPIRLELRRNFGFGAGARIQGTFTLSVPAAGDLTRVEFLVDGQPVFVDDQPPFEYRFNTADFATGAHDLSATGITTDGRSLASNTYRREFISADSAWESTRGILIPLLVVIGVVSALSALLPALLGRRSGKTFRPGEYGLAGGAVCPRCQLPYARHSLSPNLLLGKLERCPHCGKWAIVPRATPASLAAAEARLAAESTEGTLEVDDTETRLRRAIDESRFED